LTEKIICWYSENSRNLPWRNTKDPYKIWVSEIILQQTKVAKGLSYYEKIIAKYPDIQSFANATEDEILLLWQGLGYYSRARNMLATAKIIVEKYFSFFPENFEKLLELKGIGRYTAAAIVSFAFQIPFPAVDGNVVRFLSRFFGKLYTDNETNRRKIFEPLAKNLMHNFAPDLFNQAFMEFGAIVCKPLKPNCLECCVAENCFAFKNNSIGEFPQKKKAVKITNRYFYYIYIRYKNFIYIKKRENFDIWNGLFEFPLIESKSPLLNNEVLNNSKFDSFFHEKIFSLKDIFQAKIHKLSHQNIFATFFTIEIDSEEVLSENFIGEYVKIKSEKIANFATSKLIENYLKKFHNKS